MKKVNKLNNKDIEYIKDNFIYEPIKGELKKVITFKPNKNTKYLMTRINGKNVFIHRIIWVLCYGKQPNNFIDHIDGNKLNNKISNLRDVTRAENNQNRLKPNKVSTTGFLGVTRGYYRNKNKVTISYIAQISANNKRIYIGSYKTAELASEAYLKKKKELHINNMGKTK